MTAYSKTVTNSIRAFGGGPSSKWQSYNWNAFKWGDGTATVPHQVVHLVTNALVPDSARAGGSIRHLLTMQLLVSTSTVSYRREKMISNTLSLDSGPADLYVQDPNGYFHVFPEGVTNAVLQSYPNWTAASSSPVTWVTAAAGTTTWS